MTEKEKTFITEKKGRCLWDSFSSLLMREVLMPLS